MFLEPKNQSPRKAGVHLSSLWNESLKNKIVKIEETPQILASKYWTWNGKPLNETSSSALEPSSETPGQSVGAGELCREIVLIAFNKNIVERDLEIFLKFNCEFTIIYHVRNLLSWIDAFYRRRALNLPFLFRINPLNTGKKKRLRKQMKDHGG